MKNALANEPLVWNFCDFSNLDNLIYAKSWMKVLFFGVLLCVKGNFKSS